MWKDEIVEEIHQIREAYAKSFNYDLDAIFEDLRKKERESNKQVVNLSRKPDTVARWSGRGRELNKDIKNDHRKT